MDVIHFRSKGIIAVLLAAGIVCLLGGDCKETGDDMQ
jgi:hypothetical protein